MHNIWIAALLDVGHECGSGSRTSLQADIWSDMSEGGNDVPWWMEVKITVFASDNAFFHKGKPRKMMVQDGQNFQ